MLASSEDEVAGCYRPQRGAIDVRLATPIAARGTATIARLLGRQSDRAVLSTARAEDCRVLNVAAWRCRHFVPRLTA
jgi:hypothetical protein